MAVKKSTKSSAKGAAKKSSPKKAAKAASTKKSSTKKTGTRQSAPKKKASPVKLTDKQKDLLKKVSDSKEAGYFGAKGESKMLESLQTKKLIKRGKKDKTSGSYSYTVSKAGEKHM